jgi:hypothetical protein
MNRIYTPEELAKIDAAIRRLEYLRLLKAASRCAFFKKQA